MATAVIGSLRADLVASIAQFSRDMGKAANVVKGIANDFVKASKDFKRTGQEMQSVGLTLTKTITVPIVGLGLASAKAAIQFQSAFANVAKTVDGVADNTGTLTAAGKQLAQVFRDMAKTIPATTDELTKIGALGGAMGVPIDQLETFTKHVIALGVAVDDLSTEEAAAGLAAIGNATGTGTTQIAQMASALVHLGNNSNATEGQILEFTKRVIGAGNAAGLTVPDVMAISTAMANVGINAEAGGSAMSIVINKLSKAASVGGSALEEFARVADMSGEKFAATFKTKPIEAIEAFIRGLATMKARGVDLNLTMGEIGTEGLRVSDTLKRLAGSQKNLSDSIKLANDGFSAQDKHLIEAEKKYATTAKQLVVLWNRIKDVGITLGDALRPAIETTIKWIERLLPLVDAVAKAFAGLPGEIQVAVLGLAGFFALIGPGLYLAGQLVESIGILAGAFGKGGIAAGAMRGAVNLLKGAFIALRDVQIGSGVLGTLTGGIGAGAATTAGGLATWLTGIGGMYLVAGALADDFKAKLEAQAAAAKAAGHPLKALNDKLITTAEAMEHSANFGATLADGIEATGISIGDTAKKFGAAVPVMQSFAEQLADAQAELDRFAKDQPKEFADFVIAVKSGHISVEELTKRFKLSELAIDLFNDQLDRNKTALKDAAEAAEAEKKALEDVREEFFKIADAIQKLEDAAQAAELAAQWEEAVSQLRVINDDVDELVERSHLIDDALSDIYGLSGQIGAIFTKQLDEAITLTQELGQNLKKVFEGVPQLLVKAFTGGGGFLGAMKAVGVQIADAILDPLLVRFTEVLADFGKRLGAMIASKTAANLVAGGASSYATAAIAGTAAASTAAATGGTAAAATAGTGAAVGGLSAAQAVPIIGAVALGVYGVYRGLKALKEQAAHKEVNRLREVFFALEGGLERINPIVQEMTGNVDAVQAVFDARNPKQYEAALADLTGVLDAYNAKWAEQQQLFNDLSADVETVTGKLEGILVVTPEVQAALDNVFDESTTEGYLDAIKTLNGELDKQQKHYEDVQSALDQYSISFKDAGKEFQQNKINERAKKLVADFILLRNSGVEINAQMRGMGKSINDFVQDAAVAGVEVPEAMRAIIQTAIDAGEIFDADGKKITDITKLGLTFGSTMETTMKTVGTAVDKLGSVLERLAKILEDRFPAAAREGVEGINDELKKIDVPVIVPRVEMPEFSDTPPPPPTDFPAAATGGWVHAWGIQRLAAGGFARGTDTVPAMLTPGELVLNRDQQRALFAAKTPVAVQLTVNIDGVFSEGDLVQTVQRQVVPIVAQTIEDNVAGARTRFQDVLGVT